MTLAGTWRADGGSGGSGISGGSSSGTGYPGGSGGSGGAGGTIQVLAGQLELSPGLVVNLIGCNGAWGGSGGPGADSSLSSGYDGGRGGNGGAGGAGGSLSILGGQVSFSTGVTMDLSGGDGYRGASGGRGGDGSLWGDGGDGGRGGNGGDGGAGGSVSILGGELFLWPGVTINLTGGAEGARGLGGPGGEGGMFGSDGSYGYSGAPGVAGAAGSFLLNGGTFILEGGVDLGSVLTGGSFVWTSGAVRFPNGLTVPWSTVSGVPMSLTSGRRLESVGTLAIVAGGSLTLNGGRVECTEFDKTEVGTFNWTSGTLALTGGWALDSNTPFHAVGGDAISAGRQLEVAGTLNVGAAGVLDLSGGRVVCAAFDNTSGGAFNWTSGALALTGGWTLDSNTPFHAAGGDAVSAGRELEVDGTLIVGAAGTLDLSGGRVVCAAFDNTLGGTFNWDSGTLAMSGGWALDSNTPFHAVGGDAITAGRALEVAETLALGAGGTLTLNGGQLTCATFSNSSGGTFNWTAGALGFSGSLAIDSNDPFGMGGPLAITSPRTLDVAGALTVGASGALVIEGGQVLAGSLSNTAGGSLAFTGGQLTIRGGAFDPGTSALALDGPGNPTLVLTGTGATATFSGGASVGFSTGNSGTLNLVNGGTFTCVVGHIGNQAGSTGAVTVDGAGSTWNNMGELYVGFEGSGTLAITGAGSVFSDGLGYVGHSTGSTGAVTVDGAGSMWHNMGELYVGFEGSGTLAITGAGSVFSDGLGYVGHSTGSTGAVTVDGAGSMWNNMGELVV